MKKYLFLGFMAMFFTPLCAQHHFPEDSAEWRVSHTYTGVPAGKYLVSISYTKDTLVNGNLYKQLQIDNHGGKHLLRVDTLSQHLYLRIDPNWAWGSFTDSIDYLIYDFSKTIGDTIEVIGYWADTVKWYVINEGYISIGQEQRRYMDVKRFGWVYQDRWIEGVGSVRGLFAPIDEPSGWFEHSFQLVCFTDKGKGIQYEPHIFLDTTFNCASLPGDYSSIKEELFNNKIKVYPNPFNEVLNIENPTPDPYKFSLISANGRKMVEGALEEYEKQSLETSHLPKGIYILKTTSEDKITNTRIFRQ